MNKDRPNTLTEARHLAQSGLPDAVRQAVRTRVMDCLLRLERDMVMRLPLPLIRYDLAGSSAGQYLRCKGNRNQHHLRFNPYLLARYPVESLATTVPHEVAHFAVAVLQDHRRVRPHGMEWRRIMARLGAPADRTHSFDISSVPVRGQRRWAYRCSCSTHALSTTRHNRVLKGNRYYCRKCHDILVAEPESCGNAGLA